MKEISLIANTGLQFYSEEVIFDPSNPIEVREQPLPHLTFVDKPITKDKNVLSLAYSYNGKVYTLQELRENACVEQIIYNNGKMDDRLDMAGAPVINFEKVNANTITGVDEAFSYKENTINGLMQVYDEKTGDYSSPFEKILGNWIPAPMFLSDSEDSTKLACPSQ